MKKSRTILFLESLENRVVPSNSQALLGAGHGAVEASVAEIETPQVQHDAHDAGVLDATPGIAQGATIWDLASPDQARQNGNDQGNKNNDQGNNNNDRADFGPGNSDHLTRGDQSSKISDKGSSDDVSSSPGDKAANGLPKAKDSDSDHANSNPVDSTGASVVDSDSTNGSKTQSNNGSSKDKDDPKSNSGSNDSQTGSGLANGNSADVGGVNNSGSNNGSTKNKDDVKSSSSDDSSIGSKNSVSSDSGNSIDSGNPGSKNADSIGTNSVTDKANHGKSNSDHKDVQTTSNSTNSVSSGDGVQSSTAGDILGSQSNKLFDARSNGASVGFESAVNDQSGALALGFAPQAREGGAAAFSSVAAILTAQEAGLNLPRAAIPLAVPVLESLPNLLGLGEESNLTAIEALAPVAGDLIVGFLPVEQVGLGPAMQGVLNQIDELGEQLVGASTARWLYPFIFTALAATTVYHLASRRRRQSRGQSVWVRDGASWSSTWFPFLSSSIQQ